MYKRTIILISSVLAACVAVIALLWLPVLSEAEGIGGGLSASAAPMAELEVCPSGCTYSSVQAAVDAAGPGDTIKVAQGTYSDVHHIASLDTATFTATQIVAITKSVTIQGGYTSTNWTTPYPITQPTTLDAQGQGRDILISGNTISSTIEGLRVTGGDANGLGGDLSWGFDAGGGVYALNTTAIIRNTQVFSNTAERGGGLYLNQGDVTLRDNTIVSNTATLNGGGLYLSGGYAVVSGNVIAANTSDSSGGGLYLEGGYPTLSDNTIANNEARGGYSHGGGLYLFGSNAVVSRNTVSSNTSEAWGGGLHVFGGDARLDGNVIISNTAQQGGGVYLDVSNATLTNTVVADNRVSTTGSGLYIRRSSLRLLHTTIARNGSAGLTASSGGDGSGVYVDNWSTDYSSVVMTNTIIFSHTVGLTVMAGNTVTLNATLWHANGTDRGGAGSITHSNDHSGDPAFKSDGYHLTAGSAAIDKGVNAGVTTDIDGEARPIGAAYDLGADETAARYFVYLPLVLRNH